jgi:hypothetical protein
VHQAVDETYRLLLELPDTFLVLGLLSVVITPPGLIHCQQVV